MTTPARQDHLANIKALVFIGCLSFPFLIGIAVFQFGSWGNLSENPACKVIGVVCLLIGCIVFLSNLLCVWVKPLLYRLRRGTWDDVPRSPSALLGGCVFILLAAGFLSPSTLLGVLLLSMTLVDPGGPHWAFLSLYQYLNERNL